MIYLAVGCGGVIGAIIRFLLDNLITRTALPSSSGILIVNIIGCFIIGFFLSLKTQRFPDIFKIGFSTGFLGSLTTFSSFSVKSIELFMEWGFKASAIYVTMTIITGFCSVQLGQLLAKKIERG